MATFFRTRATIRLASGVSTGLLTYYWDSTGATPAAIVTEAHARVRAFWNSFAGNVAASSILTIIAAADEIEETNGQIVGQTVGTLPAAVTFTGGGNLNPIQTMGLLKLSTSTFVNGRRLQGRQFIPGTMTTSTNSDGSVSGLYITAMNTAAALLSTTVVTPINQRLWHRPVGGSGGLSAIVTSRAAGSQWSVLRSRRN